MLRKLFSVAMCSVLLIQNVSVLHADEEELYPEDEELILESNDPFSYGTNDLIIEDEGSDAYGIDVEYHSIGRIREYYQSHVVNFLDSAYQAVPSLTAPYDAGSLTANTLNDALKAVNLIRYIAGLNDNVTLNSAYTEMLQAGSLINAVNNSLSHTPSKPAGMDDALYQLGYQGNSSANIANGYSSLGKAITKGWLNDGDASNIATLGHRRWLLNATMSQTGFGQVGAYSGMYAFDTNYSSTKTSNVWPAQNTPLEFFGSDYPWSISTGRAENINNIQVKMTNLATQAEYVFKKDSAPGYFAVENSGYGVPGAVIWRPDNFTYADGDAYEVQITGLTIGDVYYRVTFFQMDLSDEKVVMEPDTLDLEVGESAQIKYSIYPTTSTDTFARRTYGNNGVIRIDHLYSSRFEITALKPGTTYVRAITTNGLEGYCNITVHGVAINPAAYESVAGKRIQFNAKYYPESGDQIFTWASSDPSIATVDENGIVTTVSAGTCTITATANGYTGTSELTVTNAAAPVTGVTLSSDSITMTKGSTSQLNATVEPADADNQDIIWSTSNTAVATVDANGLVTGTGLGTAIIRAASAEDPEIYDECSVQVGIIANSATMALEGLLKVNFYLTIPNDEADTTYIRMKLATETEGFRVKASDASLDTQGRRFFQCPIASTQMNEMITMTAEDVEGNKLPMFTAGGRNLTDGLEYSAMTYINNRVNNASTAAKMKALLSAAGEYGRNAQKNFNYGTLDQEPVTITDVTAETLKPYSLIRGGSCEGVTLKSATLECESGTNVHVYFTLSADANINDYECKVDGVTVTPEWSADKAAYRISSKDIASNQLQKMFTFTICKKTETEGITLSYGAFSYGYSKLSNTATNAALANMVKSLYKYNLAAIDYFSN